MVAGSGNSTDMAIFRWSNASLTSRDWTVVSCREFSSVEKWMGVEVRDKEGKYYVMVKGAGERVRVMCEDKGKEEGEWIRWERERGMYGEVSKGGGEEGGKEERTQRGRNLTSTSSPTLLPRVTLRCSCRGSYLSQELRVDLNGGVTIS